MDHRRGFEARAACRNAVDRARLHRQRDVFQHFLFIRDGCDALRHADAQIDDAVGRQLYKRLRTMRLKGIAAGSVGKFAVVACLSRPGARPRLRASASDSS